MDDQIILAVDAKGKFNGEYIPKWVGHTGKGQRHLAISVLLFNNHGKVLLQKRKHKVFNDIWDVTGATHPLHRPDGTDETLEEATLRCLKREYDIDTVKLKNYGMFDYYAEYEGLCENEHCAILVGEYNGPLKLNDEVGYGYKWMDKQEFLKDIEKNPTRYSPWALPAVKILKEDNFFQ